MDMDDGIFKIAGIKIKKENINVQLVRSHGDHFRIAEKVINRIFLTLVFHHLATKNKKIAYPKYSGYLKMMASCILLILGKPKTGLSVYCSNSLEFLMGFKRHL